MRNCYLGRAVVLVLAFCVGLSYQCYVRGDDNAPVFVGDTTLTHASYFFTIPAGWTAQATETATSLTNLTGYWSAEHKDGAAYLRISPHKKNKGETVQEFADSITQAFLREPGCTLDSILEYPAFKPDVKYPYQVYSFDNCPSGIWALEVFVDLPGHVVIFRLETKGNNQESLTPYLADFRQLLASFQWILRDSP